MIKRVIWAVCLIGAVLITPMMTYADFMFHQTDEPEVETPVTPVSGDNQVGNGTFNANVYDGFEFNEMALEERFKQEVENPSPPLPDCVDGVFRCALNSYMNDGGCFFCKPYQGLLQFINKIATDMFVKTNKIFQVLLGFGILFYILLKVGALIIQLHAVEASQFFQDLFKTLWRAMVASILLVATDWGSDNIFSLIVTPFFELSLSLSSQILTVIIS